MPTEPRPSADDKTTLPRTPASDDSLRAQVQRLLERHAKTSQHLPALTVMGLRGDQSDVLRFSTDRPEDALLGFCLPAKYSALVVLAASVVAQPPQRRHRDAALAIGAGRTGGAVSLLATDGAIISTREPQGWLIDACLRAVGRSTAACDIAALSFPLALWLDRLMVALVHSEASPLRWSDAVALCPIPAGWRSSDPVDLGATLGSTARSWKALRAAAMVGSYSPAGITPACASWMDDAMFARWCMGAFPDLASLRGDVEFLSPPVVAEQIAVALRSAWLAFESP